MKKNNVSRNFFKKEEENNQKTRDLKTLSFVQNNSRRKSLNILESYVKSKRRSYSSNAFRPRSVVFLLSPRCKYENNLKDVNLSPQDILIDNNVYKRSYTSSRASYVANQILHSQYDEDLRSFSSFPTSFNSHNSNSTISFLSSNIKNLDEFSFATSFSQSFFPAYDASEKEKNRQKEKQKIETSLRNKKMHKEKENDETRNNDNEFIDKNVNIKNEMTSNSSFSVNDHSNIFFNMSQKENCTNTTSTFFSSSSSSSFSSFFFPYDIYGKIDKWNHGRLPSSFYVPFSYASSFPLVNSFSKHSLNNSPVLTCDLSSTVASHFSPVFSSASFSSLPLNHFSLRKSIESDGKALMERNRADYCDESIKNNLRNYDNVKSDINYVNNNINKSDNLFYNNNNHHSDLAFNNKNYNNIISRNTNENCSNYYHSSFVSASSYVNQSKDTNQKLYRQRSSSCFTYFSPRYNKSKEIEGNALFASIRSSSSCMNTSCSHFSNSFISSSISYDGFQDTTSSLQLTSSSFNQNFLISPVKKDEEKQREIEEKIEKKKFDIIRRKRTQKKRNFFLYEEESRKETCSIFDYSKSEKEIEEKKNNIHKKKNFQILSLDNELQKNLSKQKNKFKLKERKSEPHINSLQNEAQKADEFFLQTKRDIFEKEKTKLILIQKKSALTCIFFFLVRKTQFLLKDIFYMWKVNSVYMRIVHKKNLKELKNGEMHDNGNEEQNMAFLSANIKALGKENNKNFLKDNNESDANDRNLNILNQKRKYNFKKKDENIVLQETEKKKALIKKLRNLFQKYENFMCRRIHIKSLKRIAMIICFHSLSTCSGALYFDRIWTNLMKYLMRFAFQKLEVNCLTERNEGDRNNNKVIKFVKNMKMKDLALLKNNHVKFQEKLSILVYIIEKVMKRKFFCLLKVEALHQNLIFFCECIENFLKRKFMQKIKFLWLNTFNKKKIIADNNNAFANNKLLQYTLKNSNKISETKSSQNFLKKNEHKNMQLTFSTKCANFSTFSKNKEIAALHVYFLLRTQVQKFFLNSFFLLKTSSIVKNERKKLTTYKKKSLKNFATFYFKNKTLKFYLSFWKIRVKQRITLQKNFTFICKKLLKFGYLGLVENQRNGRIFEKFRAITGDNEKKFYKCIEIINKKIKKSLLLKYFHRWTSIIKTKSNMRLICIKILFFVINCIALRHKSFFFFLLRTKNIQNKEENSQGAKKLIINCHTKMQGKCFNFAFLTLHKILYVSNTKLIYNSFHLLKLHCLASKQLVKEKERESAILVIEDKYIKARAKHKSIIEKFENNLLELQTDREKLIKMENLFREQQGECANLQKSFIYSQKNAKYWEYKFKYENERIEQAKECIKNVQDRLNYLRESHENEVRKKNKVINELKEKFAKFNQIIQSLYSKVSQLEEDKITLLKTKNDYEELKKYNTFLKEMQKDKEKEIFNSNFQINDLKNQLLDLNMALSLNKTRNDLQNEEVNSLRQIIQMMNNQEKELLVQNNIQDTACSNACIFYREKGESSSKNEKKNRSLTPGSSSLKLSATEKKKENQSSHISISAHSAQIEKGVVEAEPSASCVLENFFKKVVRKSSFNDTIGDKHEKRKQKNLKTLMHTELFNNVAHQSNNINHNCNNKNFHNDILAMSNAEKKHKNFINEAEAISDVNISLPDLFCLETHKNLLFLPTEKKT